MQNERLTRQLRDADSVAISKAAVESSSVSSAEVAKLEMQLRQTKNALEDTRAELDRVKLSSSGSEKDKAALQQQLSNDLAALKCGPPLPAMRSRGTGSRTATCSTR